MSQNPWTPFELCVASRSAHFMFCSSLVMFLPVPVVGTCEHWSMPIVVAGFRTHRPAVALWEVVIRSPRVPTIANFSVRDRKLACYSLRPCIRAMKGDWALRWQDHINEGGMRVFMFRSTQNHDAITSNHTSMNLDTDTSK